MDFLRTGKFFGETNQLIQLKGITLTNTEYTHDYVDWHYHENAYFTFILEGRVLEGNKKEKYTCAPGSLLYHHWQESHYNVKPKGYTRGFQIELQSSWFDFNSLNGIAVNGSFAIHQPELKILFHQLYKETKILDELSETTIQQLLSQVVEKMTRSIKSSNKPSWVSKAKEILYENSNTAVTLESLSHQLDIHKVHLCRDFSKHVGCTIGEYIRKIRVEKSLALFQNKALSLTDISALCGFADQSHFLRCFKEIFGLNPSTYRKILFQ